MKNNYYEEILNKVQDLATKKEYQEAIDILEQEISAPYVPSDYIDKFYKLFREVNRTFNEQIYKQTYDKMSARDLASKVYSNHKIDFRAFHMFIDKLEKGTYDLIDIKDDVRYLYKIFIDESLNNDEKVYAYETFFSLYEECIFEQKDTKLLIWFKNNLDDFDFQNNALNNVFPVKFTDNKSPLVYDTNRYFIKLKNLVSMFLFKNSSLSQIASKIIDSIFIYYLGSLPKYTEQDLAVNITNYVKLLFNDKKVRVDKEFKSWIERILAYKKLPN